MIGTELREKVRMDEGPGLGATYEAESERVSD